MTEKNENEIKLIQITNFLLGEQSLDGKWFGEKDKSGAEFWWRSHLRVALELSRKGDSNEIKRAFAMEVIEFVNKNSFYPDSGFMTIHSEELIEFVQSLLPKEEEVDWSKASEESRMEFAVNNYSNGTPIKKWNGEEGVYILKTPFRIWHGNIVDDTCTCVYSTSYNRFAEIVEPETKTDECTCTNIGSAENCSKKCGRDLEETESDEVKAEVDGEVVTVIHNTGYIAWVKQPHQEMGWLEHSKNLKPIQSLEQKARKKAEKMISKWKSEFGVTMIDLVTEGIKFDPKTL